jgi:hypothetical protein
MTNSFYAKPAISRKVGEIACESRTAQDELDLREQGWADAEDDMQRGHCWFIPEWNRKRFGSSYDNAPRWVQLAYDSGYDA